MSAGFVWFHNASDDPGRSTAFYQKLLGWDASEGPAGSTMFAAEAVPFAGLSARDSGSAGWLPYVQVDDIDAATARALTLGASLIKDKSRGPAGQFSVVCDPGGAAVALWQKA